MLDADKKRARIDLARKAIDDGFSFIRFAQALDMQPAGLRSWFARNAPEELLRLSQNGRRQRGAGAGLDVNRRRKRRPSDYYRPAEPPYEPKLGGPPWSWPERVRAYHNINP